MRRCSSSTASTPTTGRSTSCRGCRSTSAQGELVCLLGGNASGKSTTLKTILGIVRPRNGTVRVDGEDVTKRPTSYRIGRGLAIVPENRRLFAPMTVLENLEMGAYLRGGGSQGGLRARLRALPAAARAPLAARGHAVGRRAADGRDGPRADVAAEAPADGRAVDGPRADPRRAELRDHQAGARIGRRDARRRAERERVALDRRPRLRPLDRPARARGHAPPTCARTRSCGRPTLAVSDVLDRRARCRHRFPIFERLVYVNSCSQGALSDSVRAAYDDYLDGWDERGAPWDYWVERTEAARATFARLVGGAAGRRRGHDLALGRASARSRARSTSSERPKVVISDFEFPTIGQIWHAQELRGAEVVHVPRRRAPRSRSSGSRRRSTSGRRSSRSPPSATGTARGSPSRRSRGSRTSAARSSCSTPTRRSGTYPLDVGDARRRRARGRRPQVPARLGRARRSCGCGRGSPSGCCRRRPAGSPTRTSSRWTSPTTRPSPNARRFQSGTPPIPAIYGGIAGIELMQEIGIAETREHVPALERAADRGRRRARRHRRHAARAERRGALVCIALDRRARAGGRARR